MRSLKYIISGSPHNLDDCVDMVKNRELVPDSVSMELEITEYPHEALVMVKQMISVYHWKFNEGSVTYEEICGACFFTESEKRQKLSIENANLRLENTLSRINSLGIDVSGKEKCFDYSLIYREEL